MNPQNVLWFIMKNAFSFWIVYDTAKNIVYDSGNYPLDYEYDYIVVGGGTAGSAVAGRLASHNYSVLLVEAGGEQSAKLKIPWFHSWLHDSPHSWFYSTLPQRNGLRGYENRKSLWWRGRVIGGTGAINTLIYMRGNKLDYDNWSDFGLRHWTYNDVLPFFKKLENVKGTGYQNDTLYHGNSGPINLEEPRHYTPLRAAFLQAGKNKGYPIVDQNAENQYGVSHFLFTTKNGHRWTSADGYIGKKPPPMLRITLKTTVIRILFLNKEAVGVILSKNRKKLRVFARREVILSAGVLETPKLLMLSGIGPSKHLKDVGILPIVDSPGVGNNLQDHIASYGLTWLTSPGYAYNPFTYTFGFDTYLQWKTDNSGPLGAPIGVEGNGFVSSKYSTKNWPDLQLTFMSTHAGYDGGTLYKSFLGLTQKMYDSYFKHTAFKEGYTIYPILNRPESRGYIKLKSADPSDSIIIQPNYLSSEMDIKRLIEGMKICKYLGDDKAFKSFGSKFYSKPLPGCETLKGDDYWRCWVLTLSTTDHHPVGTARMGTDSEAVVDEDLRVRGVSRLRIADASVIPRIPSGNINIPTLMIAERLADKIIS